MTRWQTGSHVLAVNVVGFDSRSTIQPPYNRFSERTLLNVGGSSLCGAGTETALPHQSQKVWSLKEGILKIIEGVARRLCDLKTYRYRDVERPTGPRRRSNKGYVKTMLGIPLINTITEVT